VITNYTTEPFGLQGGRVAIEPGAKLQGLAVLERALPSGVQAGLVFLEISHIGP
jgi:hypothetical protein